MLCTLLCVWASAIAATSPARAQSELVLEGDNIITVMLRNAPVTLEVDPGHTGPVALNPATVERLGVRGQLDMTYDYGAFEVQAATSYEGVEFGGATRRLRVAWTAYPASAIAEGVIGVHDLPFDRVTLRLRPALANESVQTLPLRYRGTRRYQRLGVEQDVADKRMFFLFSNTIEPNFVSARTANFLATNQEGGFLPGTASQVAMGPGIIRPTLDMHLAHPLLLGELEINRFAVRIEDYGRPHRVEELAADDPRVLEDMILVTRRAGRGRPDLTTRIGRAQLSHCSQMVFDKAAMQLHLTCGLRPMAEQS